MNTFSLNGIWQLRGRPQEGDPGRELLLHAVVPGCVQLDLSREGYLPADLYMGENIRQTEAYEDWEWWYERTFTAPEQRDNVWLVFEGVDCLAQYYINGQKIGESENMLIPHQFEISRYVQEGENTLTVHLSSPVIAAHWGSCGMGEDVLTHLCGTDMFFDTSFGYGTMPKYYAQKILEKHGSDKLLFGTDTPWHTPQMELRLLSTLGLSDADLRKITEGNARRLLKI